MPGTHRQFNDEQFEARFLNCSFPPALFNHEAHIRLGFIHLNKYDIEKAITNVCQQIKKFDQTHGDGTKYDEQLTIASMLIIKDLMQRTEAKSFAEFMAHSPDLLSDFKLLVNTKLAEL